MPDIELAQWGVNVLSGRRRSRKLRQVVVDVEPGRLRVDEDVSLRPHAGVVVERAHRDERNVALAIEARQLRAAAPAEDAREEPSLRHLVRLEQLLAGGDTHAVEAGEEIRRVGGTARLAAALAVTVLDAQRLALDDEGDPSAETAPARLAGRGGAGRNVRQHRGVDARGVGLPGRQPRGDVVPGRLRADEDVSHRPDAGVVVEHARGNKELALPRLRVVRNGRATAAAKGPREARRRLVARDPVAAPGEAEVGGVAHDLARERRPVRLAAARAVAMGHELERPRDLPRHVAAETAAVHRHDAPPSRVRTSTRPSGWPTSTRSAVPRKSPVSTTPGMARIEASRVRAAAPSASGVRGAQSRVKLPLSVQNGAPSAPGRTVGVSPSARSSRDTRPRASGITSTGMRPRCPSRSTSFSGPTRMTCRRDAAATMRSRTSAPPQPFTRSRLGATSSAPSTVRSRMTFSSSSIIAMPRASACLAVASEVAAPTMRSPCRTRPPSSSTNAAAARPVPSPSLAPSATISAACRATDRKSVVEANGVDGGGRD